MKSSRITAVLSGAVLTGTVVFAVSGIPAQSGAQAAGEPKTAEQAFKNIQILKGIPADQLLPTMQFVANSLGVECSFCHVDNAFEKDDKKPKATARRMMQMQFAINKDNFNGDRQVTCFSCHRGSHSPVGIPSIADEEPKRPEAPKTPATPEPALPTADQVLEKFIQAVGGADALQKVTTRSSKGTISFSGGKSPIEILAKSPNKRISMMHTPNGDSITAFDGQSGWLGNGGRPARDMSPVEAHAASFDADFSLALDLKKMFDQLRVRPADKIGEHDVVQLIGTKQGHPPLRLFFDQQSGLLVRSIRYADTALGRNPTQVDYADYREQNGIKLAFRWTLARPLGRFTIQLDQVQQNVPVDDAKFAKPAAPPAPSK
ncbi:MAG TPA: c-type cytochrome [Candidatus Angelobacter sp.]|nr:c-type cytochrome [Candidatus Angelobacter sp.]